MEITATAVKNLREKTGAGMMDCKKALVEANGDEKEAEKLLKVKGLAAVAKRAGRITSEGRIFAKIQGNKAVMAELTCETDFVAKNADFIKVGEAVCDRALAKGYGEVNPELSEMLMELATKIQENMALRRLVLVDIPSGTAVKKYIHSDSKTGVLALVSADPASAASSPEVEEFTYDCCLHIAAYTPQYNSRADVPASYIEEQKAIFVQQTESDAKLAEKSEKVREGIVQGKVNKHLAEICFMDQLFVKDDKVTVAKKMEEIGKKAGAKLSLYKTVLFRLGV
jgi:elongation factor Ts